VSPLLLWAGRAGAEVQRFAVIVGSNQGRGGDTPLRYAEKRRGQGLHRAARSGRLSAREHGALEKREPSRISQHVDHDQRSDSQRVRAAGTDTLLFVYYSGHADQNALHLGSQELPIAELSQLVRGSAAKFRLLVVDACRSGALTPSRAGVSFPRLRWPATARSPARASPF
jgi:hypothetical protein